MLIGATKKRFYYCLSAFSRFIAFVGLLIAYIVVKITVKPNIDWLNALLICLSIASLVTAVYNLILCGFTANQYKDNFAVQLICFLICLFTGGIVSTTFTGVAVFTKVLPDEVKNEGIFNTKTFKNKDGKYEDETKK
ncbi:MAG: hypothetical protein ACI4PF_06640 [Christensenellales bacterium]